MKEVIYILFFILLFAVASGKTLCIKYNGNTHCFGLETKDEKPASGNEFGVQERY